MIYALSRATDVRVLITGGSGMLGATLAPILRICGHDVLVHGHSTGGDVYGDLTDRNATASLVAQVKAECIVNLVALTNVDKCEIDPHAAYLLNVKTVENLATAIREQGGVHLIQISTDQVYDAGGLSMEDEIRLTNTYALTKYAGEIAASLVSGTVLRTNFFGPSALPGRYSFSDWLLNNLREQTPMSAFSDVIVNPLSMNTLSVMIERAIQKPVAGVFNLGSRNPLSKADFALQTASIFGLNTGNMTTGQVDARGLCAYRPKDMSMDCTRFESTFNVNLPTLRDEIRTLRKEIR